jgi:tripartite-type tricarboxylate transporter receptor subunit TctC
MGPQVTGSPGELQAFVKTEIERWSPIVRRAGVAGTQ